MTMNRSSRDSRPVFIELQHSRAIIGRASYFGGSVILAAVIVGVTMLAIVIHHMMTEGRRGRRWAGLSGTSKPRGPLPRGRCSVTHSIY